MYTKHFGLNLLPFENVSDPKFFFDQGDHARVYQRLIESLTSGQGLTVVTGAIGAGKTMLSQMLIYNTSNVTEHIWIAEPPENSINLFLFIALELGLKPVTSEKTFVLRDIKEALVKIRAEGNKCMVIIDESQTISEEIRDGIQLLNNLEKDAKKLIQIYLFGQEEIMTIINSPENESFKQRIATLETMGKMKTDKIRDYISHRLKVAGGQPSIFSETGWEAISSLFSDEGSIPRVINSLCNKSLIAAFESEKDKVDYDDVCEAAKEMGIYNEISHCKTEPKQSSEESEGGKVEQGNGHTGTSLVPLNESEKTEIVDKVCENYYGAFLSKIMGIKNRVPEYVKDSELDTANVADSEREEPSMLGESNKYYERKVVNLRDGNSFEPAKIEGINLPIIKKSTTSSEWVTINAKGEQPFDPEIFDKIKPTTMREITAKLDEWETIRGVKSASQSDKII